MVDLEVSTSASDVKKAVSVTGSLAPGFRFHPTDEELVRYYLRRKIASKPFRFDAISDIDIYKAEPWDLPRLSKLKSRDLEWYFFSGLDNKYSNGSKTNRATEKGYWKTTGKDRPVYHRTKTVGMKKTLVYHSGRAPKGARSNWVMHEYRLVDEELEKAGIRPRDAAVLCRVFQKSGTGPKNGEQYGAPLIEDDWENDDLAMVPGEVAMGEVAFADDFYLDSDELDQILETENPPEDVPLPDSFYYGDEGIQVEQPENFIDDPPKPLIDASGCIIPEEFDGQKLFHLPVENDMDLKIVKHEFMGESSNFIDSEDIDYLIDEAFLDPTINPPIDDVAFLEANDLSNPIEDNHSNFDKVEDYLNFFDTDEDNSFYADLFSSTIMGSENLATPLFEQDVDGGAFQENVESELVLQGQNDNLASTSNQEPSYYESAKDKNFSDIKYPSYLKQGSCMQPSFASEYPSKKGLSLGASHSSSPIHVTAGMMFIRNISVTGDGTYWAPGKNLEVNIVLSQINEEDCGFLLTKSVYALSRMWYYLMILIWVMILPLSFQLGSCLYTRKAL